MFMRHKRICCCYRRYGLKSGAIRNFEIDAAIEICYFSPYSGICKSTNLKRKNISILYLLHRIRTLGKRQAVQSAKQSRSIIQLYFAT